MTKPYFYAVGKRKTARACVKIFDGSGEIKINEKKIRDWVDTDRMYFQILQPLEILGIKKNFDIEIRTSGGGKNGQTGAILLGIARAILKKNADFKLQLREAGFLTRDSRKKERKKPGLKRARRAPQWSKR